VLRPSAPGSDSARPFLPLAGSFGRGAIVAPLKALLTRLKDKRRLAQVEEREELAANTLEGPPGSRRNTPAAPGVPARSLAPNR
jgi:hypothetical protein